MSNHIRLGDRVFVTHHMSQKGVVTEIFYRPVKAGSMHGTFTKQMWLKFKSELTGEIISVKRQDVMKET